VIAEDQRLVKKVSLTVNGHPVQVVADPKQTVLLDLVREDLGLTGTKQSCDRKGQCGTCMVLVDGKAVLSCVTKVAPLEGADVTTIEGLGTPDQPHLIQQAFVLAGAVQCGFCIPGMIVTAKELLDANPDPTRAEIKRALRRNLCRCTGYVKIIDAVQLAGRFLRGEIAPADLLPGPDAPPIGVSHPRPSAMAKACGSAAFGADIRMPGALEVAVVRSSYAHAVIRGIDATAAEAMPGVAGVMTARDILGTNRLKYTVADRPVLCDDKVRTLGDAVAIVAAETKEQALAAVEAVVVDYEPLPVLASPDDALAEDAPRVHPDTPNLCHSQPIIKGDAASAFAAAAATVEARFRTQINHQAPLEPEVSLAYMEGEGEDAELVVIGRSINIHLAMASLQAALGWEAIRYEEAFSGGQFGIKVEVITEGIAAAAALHFRRPVRYVPSLAESMLVTSKRHPFDMGIRLAADANGRLTALGMDITVDNGAYMSLGIVILNRALHMLTSSYYVPNIDVTSRLVYTNNPWGSAARGAGPPQTHYAVECAIDMLAEKMGIDPLEFRRRNSLKPGETKATGHVVREWPFPGLCDAIRPAYEEAHRAAAAHAAEDPGNRVRRGVGLGAAAFGIAMPGDKSIAAVELDPDDGATVYVAAADPGEGNDSMLNQLVAHVLDLPLAKVRLRTRSTADTTASGPASGSRVTYMIGGAAGDAAQQLRAAMEEEGARTHAAFVASRRPTRYVGRRTTLETAPLDPETGQGPSFEVQVFSVQMAEVEVDVETGEVRVLRLTSAADPGRVIHPQNVEGQLQGGMDMGAGFALREEFVAGKTKDWVTFKFPSIRYAMDLQSIVVETPRELGTLGSVGIGEMAMVSTAPAIINAIRDACGAMVFELPARPERVLAALAAAGARAPAVAGTRSLASAGAPSTAPADARPTVGAR
jgi:aldehyde oxidoreductase